MRSEERRVGKECRSRWSPYNSSRRRHTRLVSDWSSDVCSSDLSHFPHSEADVVELAAESSFPTVAKCINAGDTPASSPRVSIAADREQLMHVYRQMEAPKGGNEIGRASCRERV